MKVNKLFTLSKYQIEIDVLDNQDDTKASFTHTDKLTVFLYRFKMGSVCSYGAIYT